MNKNIIELFRVPQLYLLQRRFGPLREALAEVAGKFALLK